MKYCPNCGSKIKSTDKICSNCGKKLNIFQVTPTMRKNKRSSETVLKVVIGVCLVALLAGGGYFLYDHFNGSDSQATQSTKSSKKASSKSSKSAKLKKNTAKANDDDSSSSVNDSDDNSKADNNAGGYWNSSKQAKFDDFFNDWADTMDQDYTKYSGSGTFKAGGVEYPTEFDRFDVDGQPVSIGMSKDGKGNKDYNVVGIYNHGDYEFHITYFFAFHNGQPVVLVDQTTNGDRVQAKVTENKKLREGFARIAEGD